MLTFNLGETKRLNMSIDATGIDPAKLNFMFSIIVNSVSYGFTCEYKISKLSVDIPSLDTIVKGIKAGEYDARLDIFGDKYYMCPFSEKIKVVTPVKVSIEFEEKTGPEKEEKKPKVKIEEETIEEVKEIEVDDTPAPIKSKFKDKFSTFKKSE